MFLSNARSNIAKFLYIVRAIFFRYCSYIGEVCPKNCITRKMREAWSHAIGLYSAKLVLYL